MCRIARLLSEKQVLLRLGMLYGSAKVKATMAQWALWREQDLEYLVERDQGRIQMRMYDVSEFMKTVKQRFTQGYNRQHSRTGTLWEDRFKSVLVEGTRNALATMAAYIDLNAVRAGIVADPKEYRWCGYAEAVAGKAPAREGIRLLMKSLGRETQWRSISRAYRMYVYAGGEEKGLRPEGGPMRSGLSRKAVQKVLEEGGKLSHYDLLRCRVRYFSDGAVLGSKAYVNRIFREHRDYFSPKRKDGARAMRNAALGGLCTARALRLDPIRVSPSS